MSDLSYEEVYGMIENAIADLKADLGNQLDNLTLEVDSLKRQVQVLEDREY